jgi:hypothetical protein
MHDFIVDPVDLPQIPRHLITPLDRLLDSGLVEVPLIKPGGEIQDNSVYKVLLAPDPLVQWLKTIFDFEFTAEYLWLSSWSKKHTDLGRTMAYNYLLDAGGENITTNFYAPNNEEEIVKSIVIPLRKWHVLNVSMPHVVVAGGPSPLGIRYMLSVTPKHATFEYS